MAYDANYASIPRAAVAVISTANTSSAQTSSTTGITNLFTAGSAGSRVDDITIEGNGTVTNGMIRFWYWDGTNHTMFREVSVTATTPSGTVQQFSSYLSNLALILPAGTALRVSTNNAETFAILVTRAGDF